MISSKKIELSLIAVMLISIGFISTKAIIAEGQTYSENQNPMLFVHGWTRTKIDWELMISLFQADVWPETMLFANSFDDTNNC